MEEPALPRRSSSLAKRPAHDMISGDTNGHTRGISMADIPVRTNRFSLTFPILPTSKEVSPIQSTFTAESASNDSAIPTDGSLLTAIAAQERRVLEIKEELQKAEADLNKLKLQWASHEAQKKKDEVKRTTRLRPVSTILPGTDKQDVTGSNAWMQHEMDRRKALMSHARSSSRRVFSGSKHTRTLSLLTPSTSGQAPLHRPRGATSPVKNRAEDSIIRAEPQLPRAATTPNLSTDEQSNDIKIDLGGLDKDLLLKTGKKMAMDLKDGIWTFWEDLRQATVGEDMVEIVPPSHLRHQASGQSLRAARRGGAKGSIRGSSRGSTGSRQSNDSRSAARSPTIRAKTPREHQPLQLTDVTLSINDAQPAPLRTPTTNKKCSKHSKAPSVAISAASSDAFDAWDDSPQASRSSSATSESAGRPSLGSKEASPTSRLETLRDPIPWPSIAKFGPATLRRTASHLMSEWDKLSPPPHDETPSTGYLEAVKAPDKAKKQD